MIYLILMYDVSKMSSHQCFMKFRDYVGLLDSKHVVDESICHRPSGLSRFGLDRLFMLRLLSF